VLPSGLPTQDQMNDQLGQRVCAWRKLFREAQDKTKGPGAA
jgi:hypothetical protein